MSRLVDVRIEENKIEYDSLCERYEIITSEYEDVSKSDVIKDIAEWNVRVHNYKYWGITIRGRVAFTQREQPMK